MTLDEKKELLAEFLNRWPIRNVKKLTLQEYVGLRNPDTFCQWVETKTRMLGSIKGQSSIKFGIFERNDPDKKLNKNKNDSRYTWIQAYGGNRKTAFNNTKNDIIKIIQLSKSGNFAEIDNIHLPHSMKWKVAFLFSNEKLIPIYKRKVLFKIAKHFGLTKPNPRISEIQAIMMLNKPAGKDVYTFMGELYGQFNSQEITNEIVTENGRRGQKRTTRQAAKERNTTTQSRTVTSSYSAEQNHNKIQEALVKKLSKKYGKGNVVLEENYVDIKLIQPRFITFYEVKSSACASDCIKDALGQILLYSLNDKDKRPKKHIIAGQSPATEDDKKYIDFLKLNLKLEFDYEHVKIK